MHGTELPIEAIRRCAADPTFVAEVEAIYAALDARVAARNPVCINRGDCCRFSEFGHRLFVTSAELAYFLAQSGPTIRYPASAGACPYQVGGRCTAREQRPTGCRIFYCDPNAQHWQGPETEEVLGRLKDLHVRYGLPYAYVDWTDALRMLAT